MGKKKVTVLKRSCQIYGSSNFLSTRSIWDIYLQRLRVRGLLRGPGMCLQQTLQYSWCRGSEDHCERRWPGCCSALSTSSQRAELGKVSWRSFEGYLPNQRTKIWGHLGNVSEQLISHKHSDDMKPPIKGTKCDSNISSHWSTTGRLSQERATKVASTTSDFRFHVSSLQRGYRSTGPSPGEHLNHLNQTIFLTVKVLPDSSFHFTMWRSKLLAFFISAPPSTVNPSLSQDSRCAYVPRNKDS